ncbi:MAG: Smr/MutS family protein, partial [Dehalococcoidales bacterium]
EQTLSSFSWHMNNAVRIIDNTTGQSLVLLDELGTSTDPAEGSALARAMLLHFLSQKTLTVATTHYADLKAFAHNTPGIQNASFDFNPDTLAPTYHMTLGIPGGSNALATAGRLGIPSGIIDRARTMLSKGALDLDAALADIMAEKQKISGARELLEKERESVNAQNAEIESRLAKLRAEERRTTDEARDSIIREAAELNRQVRKAGAELRRKTSRETVETARNTLASMKSKLDSPEWTPGTPQEAREQGIRAGDTVTLSEFGLRAMVLAVSEEKGEVEVQAGQTRITVGINNVEKVSGTPAARTEGKAAPVLPPTASVPATLDLRGKRADEVEVAVDMYLSDAALTNLNEVVIIHGFGTGTVRQIVRDFLSGHPLVSSFRAGGKGEGGDGATVVSL